MLHHIDANQTLENQQKKLFKKKNITKSSFLLFIFVRQRHNLALIRLPRYFNDNSGKFIKDGNSLRT